MSADKLFMRAPEPKTRAVAAALAAFTFAPMTAAPAFAQDAVAPRVLNWGTPERPVGRAPFANSVREAVDARHLGWIFNLALSEGDLDEVDRTPFLASAPDFLRAVLSSPQATIEPGREFNWMSYAGGAGLGLQRHDLGDGVVRVATRHPVTGPTFEYVRRRDGATVRFYIVDGVNPEDGRPCRNVVSEVIPRVPAPITDRELIFPRPLPAPQVDVCPNLEYAQATVPRGMHIATRGRRQGQCVEDANALPWVLGGLAVVAIIAGSQGDDDRGPHPYSEGPGRD